MSLNSPRSGSRYLAALVAVFVALLFAALSVLRASRVAGSVGAYVGCRECFWLPTLGHDAWLLAAILGLFALALWIRSRVPGFVLRLAAGLLLVLFAADIALDTLLAQRLYLADVLRLGKHAAADFSVAKAGLGSPEGLLRSAIVMLALLAFAGLCAAKSRSRRLVACVALGAAAAALFSAFALSRPMRYVNELFVYNIVEANLPQGRLKTFSPDFIARQQSIAERIPRTCDRGGTFSGNVVILLVESLSAWHSGRYGGAGWTPELDAIARENHVFTQFYANGFTTSGAAVAVLAGRPPIPPAGKAFYDYSDFPETDGTLPDVAHRSGRQAAFFTTGELSFLDLGPWLEQLHFDVADGSSSPFYRGMKRWQFGAAADSALYDRFLDWQRTREDARPYVAALLTVSTHPPYIDPRTSKVDPENAFRYADSEIGRFYRALRDEGFFENGVLLILGDHRTMTPLHDDEYRAFGDRAFARVPLVVAGPMNLPPVVDAPFQQTDIANSIADLVGAESCRSPFVGRFLREAPEPADYVVHGRGDDRDRIDVYWNGSDVSPYRLDGDASHWLGPKPPLGDGVAAWIDAQRGAPRGRNAR